LKIWAAQGECRPLPSVGYLSFYVSCELGTPTPILPVCTRTSLTGTGTGRASRRHPLLCAPPVFPIQLLMRQISRSLHLVPLAAELARCRVPLSLSPSPLSVTVTLVCHRHPCLSPSPLSVTVTVADNPYHLAHFKSCIR